MATEFANMDIISNLMKVVLMEWWVLKSDNDGFRNEKNWGCRDWECGFLFNTFAWGGRKEIGGCSPWEHKEQHGARLSDWTEAIAIQEFLFLCVLTKTWCDPFLVYFLNLGTQKFEVPSFNFSLVSSIWKMWHIYTHTHIFHSVLQKETSSHFRQREWNGKTLL